MGDESPEARKELWKKQSQVPEKISPNTNGNINEPKEK